MIQNVDVYDEGPYTCSVQTDNHPKTSRVHLIVQGRQVLVGQSELNTCAVILNTDEFCLFRPVRTTSLLSFFHEMLNFQIVS